MKKLIAYLTNLGIFFLAPFGVNAQVDPAEVIISERGLGFQIPTFSDLLTFIIRFFFVLAGLAALLFLLWGSIDWITSGGDKDKVESARNKIVQALMGVIVVIATLTIIWSLENIVFQKKLCFGISCPITLPELLKPV